MSEMTDDLDLYELEYDEPEMIRFESLLRETPKAWFIRFPMKDDLTNDDVWLPKSQCEIDRRSKTIEVPGWLMEEKNLYDYTI